jgi:SAM-dependent methyltransferase
VTRNGAPACLFCGAPLHHTVIDLGMSPLCESYVPESSLNDMEQFYPLHVRVCEECLLVQLEEYVSPEEIFTEYAYFSAYSDSWVEHARVYTEMAIERFGLTPDDLVVEVASNDGYLLQHFVERGHTVLGIEPAQNVADAAIERGVPTLVEFFGVESATRLRAERGGAALIIGNNVLAQVPGINDFVGGLAALLAPNGVVTIEFPHLRRLIDENQFDTIYHEHFFYFSLLSSQRIFAAHGLELFDVEELPTHGGSLRIYAHHADDTTHALTDRLRALLASEVADGYETLAPYEPFRRRVEATKRDLLEFLIDARRAGKRVAGYGAPGKGNTLLNYCGIRTDFVDFTVDRNPYKQGMYLPGTHIPIRPPEEIDRAQPDVILILPWNLRNEIAAQLEHTRRWGAELVVPIPGVEVLARPEQP